MFLVNIILYLLDVYIWKSHSRFSILGKSFNKTQVNRFVLFTMDIKLFSINRWIIINPLAVARLICQEILG